jgi:Mrp family chromosome partitioning ATPase
MAYLRVMGSKHPPGDEPVDLPSVGVPRGELDLEAEMLQLQRAVDDVVPAEGGRCRVLVFTSARAGEGTSTIVRAFARLLADRTKGSTLVLDANQRHPTQHEAFGVGNDVGWDDLGPSGDLDRAIYRTSFPRLWVSPLSGDDGAASAALLEGAIVERLLRKLGEWFDHVIVDSGPLASCPTGLAIAQQSDGVLLVVEADETRWPVALAAKTAIEKSGARALGVVLNKRRHHIPAPVYRLL